MTSLNWCLIIPTVFLLIAVEGCVGVAVNYLRDSSLVKEYDTVALSRGKHFWGKVWPILLIILTIGGFVVLLAIISWFMYSTPAKFFFQGIDRSINNALGTIPNYLLFIYFGVPIVLMYCIYFVMATIYDFNKSREYDEKNKKRKERQKKLQKSEAAQPVHLNISGTFQPLVKEMNELTPMKFRRELNALPHDNINGIKYKDSYFVVVDDETLLKELQRRVTPLLDNVELGDKNEVVIVANDSDKTIKTGTKQHAVNLFRNLGKSPKGVKA